MPIRQSCDKLITHLNINCRSIESNLSVVEDFPVGWARTAAFLASNGNFTNFRAFNYLNTRVLLKLQNELEHLEIDLKNLDNSDSAVATEEAFDRLQGRTSELNDSSPQDEVLAKCQTKLLIYS